MAERSRDYLGRRLTALGAATALVLAGCGSPREGGDPEATQTPGITASPTGTPSETLSATPNQSQRNNVVMGKFTVLGGRIKQVMVYQGAGESPSDRVSTMQYVEGQEVPLECKESGRTINSVPADGESTASSNEWARLAIDSRFEQNATRTYLDVPKEQWAQLRDCNDVPTRAVDCLSPPAVSSPYAGDPEATSENRDKWKAIIASTELPVDAKGIMFAYRAPGALGWADTSKEIDTTKAKEVALLIGPGAVQFGGFTVAAIGSASCGTPPSTIFSTDLRPRDQVGSAAFPDW